MKPAILLLLLPVLFIIEQASSQNIKAKIEKKYRFTSDKDSTISSKKNLLFDIHGRLLEKKEHYYNQDSEGTLNKEIISLFDSSNMILEDKIITYKKSMIEQERLKTKYFIYSPKEEESKYIWRLYYDVNDELMKEDTLSYDKNANLISRMVYDYRGSTSQSGDFYKYDKNNKLKRWRWYTYWTTVNKKSIPVTKRDKKQDYRYRYKNGKLIKVKGKRYSTRYSESFVYDKNTRLSSYQMRKFRKTKKSKAQRKKDGQKYNITDEKIIRKYQNGFMTYEIHTYNGSELNKTEICYHKDSLVSSRCEYSKGVKNKEIKFEYNPENRLIKSSVFNFINGRVHTITDNFYDNNGKLIREVKSLNGSELNRSEYQYDNNNNLIKTDTYMKTKSGNRHFEYTEYQYEFY